MSAFHPFLPLAPQVAAWIASIAHSPNEPQNAHAEDEAGEQALNEITIHARPPCFAQA